MKKFLAGLIMVVALAGCERATIESRTVVAYKIVGINPPKHFRVSLQDSTGRIFQNVSVSKHCSRWREVKLGTTINLTTDIMKLGQERWVDIHASFVCPNN